MEFIRYSYLKNQKQLIISCNGEIIESKLVEELREVFSSASISNDIVLVLDTRNASKKASLNANNLYSSFFKSEKIYSRIRQMAIIADSPAQVVQSMIFKDEMEELLPAIKIFSTVEYAIDWICPQKYCHTVENFLKLLSVSRKYKKAA